MVVTDFPYNHCLFGLITHGFLIFDDRIDFYAEFCPEQIQDSILCTIKDTLYLKPLEVGSYNINLYNFAGGYS